MSDLKFLPSIGMSGLYTLKAPYDLLIMSTIEYTCTSIESLQGSIARGEDPYTDVYEASGATQSDYDNDLAAGAYLITITSGDGDVVTFPSTALVKMPDTDGVRYRNLVLGISLSSLPDSLNLDGLRQDISDLVFNSVGVRSTTYTAQVGGITILTRDQHNAVEAARQANVTNLESPIYRVAKLERDNASLIQKVAELEAYIRQHRI